MSPGLFAFLLRPEIGSRQINIGMINAASQNLIKSYEGLRPTAYLDAVGVPTIGWGHTKTVTKADVGRKTISQAEAQRLFDADIAEFEKAVARLVTVPLTENQRGALVSFAYNLGAGNLGSSTLLKKLNAKDYKGAQAEFGKWNRAGGKVLAGLTKRRAAEAELFGK